MSRYKTTVPDDGRLSRFDREQCAKRIAKFAGKKIEIVFQIPETKRSNPQNSWLHCKNGPATLLAKEWGTSVAVAKLLLMGECFGWADVQGMRLPAKPHTSELTTEEFSHFVDWVIPWAMEHFYVEIPPPDEALAA